MSNEVTEVKKVGIFKGMGMMWSSFVNTVLILFSAMEDGAKVVKQGTGVLKQQVSQWEQEMQEEFEVEMEEARKKRAESKAQPQITEVKK
jgi:gas vesicle protein